MVIKEEAMTQSAKKPALMPIGCDDGHSMKKIALPDGRLFSIRSTGRAGVSGVVGMRQGANGGSVATYETDDGTFAAGDMRDADSTASDAYPTSPLNRVLVMHALLQAGVESGAVAITTGLPVRRYFRKNEFNNPVIRAKSENLMRNDVKRTDGGDVPVIKQHNVVSEGVASWFGHVSDVDDNGKVFMHQDLARERTAIVDIGGRTTDIAVIREGEVDISRSKTREVGMFTCIEALRDEVQDEYGTEPDDDALMQAIEKGTLPLWGKEQDVQKLTHRALQEAANRIRSQTMAAIGDGSDLAAIVFVGGTTIPLSRGGHLDGWFPNQRIAPEPGFANAIGMLRFQQFLLQKQSTDAGLSAGRQKA